MLSGWLPRRAPGNSRTPLFAPGVDPTADSNAAIRLAAEHGHDEVVSRLMDILEVDPSACDNEAIGLAAANGHREVVKELLSSRSAQRLAMKRSIRLLRMDIKRLLTF